MKLVAPKGAIWRIWARAFNPMVYSPSVSFLLSGSNSFSSMSSSSTSGVSSEWTTSSSVPSKALEIPQVLKDLMTISLGISAHTSLIHQRTRFLLDAFFFQAGVNSNGPNVIHAKYFRCTLSLNGLFRHLSKGCTTGVRPPGIIVTSMFRCFRSSFTKSVKWAWNESHTKRERSACGKLCQIHSRMPCSSIHPFLWKETRRGCGTTRSLGVRTPLKMTFGGHLCSIGSNSKNDGEALLFRSARFYWHSSAPTEFQCLIQGQLKMHGCLIHVVDAG